MAENFVLIPGRTSRQGTSLNVGKDSAEYLEETGTVLVSPEDMAKLGLVGGEKVRLRSEHGEAELVCQAARKDELPRGLLFVSYGPQSSKLMGGDTHGTGMPDSKGIDVEMEKV